MLEAILQNSRVSTLISQIERGEQVDFERLWQLQLLDVVRLDENFVAESLLSERASDDRASELFARS